MHETLNRRGFLAGAAAIAASAGTASAQTPIKRAGAAKLKTSLNAYSFNKTLSDNLKDNGTGMTLLDLLDYCAEQNFDALDPTGYYFPGYPKPPTDKYLNEFKRHAFQRGLDISGTGVRNHFASADKEKRAADVRHVKEWVEVAARLGAPVLRAFAGPMPAGHAWDAVAEWMADAFRECTEHGQKYGVLIGVQHHGDALVTSEQVLKLLKLVNSEWFGVVVDTGFFPEPDPYPHIAAVAPFAVNWQVKEYTDGNKLMTKIDLKRIVKIAHDSGYRGYLPIETLPRPGEDYDPKARVARLLKELRAEIG